MVLNKKAISPVVATALLLVVAVVAVVGFQTWFNTYQSGLNAKVETQSNAGSALTVELLQTDGAVYVKNSGTDDISVSNISVTTSSGAYNNCSATGTASGSSVTTFDVGTCSSMTSGASYGITIVTSSGVYRSTQLAR